MAEAVVMAPRSDSGEGPQVEQLADVVAPASIRLKVTIEQPDEALGVAV